MRTVSERDPTYFGVIARPGVDQYEMRASIDFDIATLRLSGIDVPTLVFLVDNLDDTTVTALDSFCTKIYVTERASIIDIAFEKGISETEVLDSIIKTITCIVNYLKQLQDHHMQNL